MSCPPKKSLPAVESLLRNHGFRATPVRRAALAILSETQAALSVQELFDALAEQLAPKSPDWATVYRILVQFEESGLVFSFDAHGSKRYEYVRSDASHHHHLICRQCERIEHLPACRSQVLKRMTQAFDYTDVTHTLEFYGVCPDCAGAAAA